MTQSGGQNELQNKSRCLQLVQMKSNFSKKIQEPQQLNFQQTEMSKFKWKVLFPDLFHIEKIFSSLFLGESTSYFRVSASTITLFLLF